MSVANIANQAAQPVSGFNVIAFNPRRLLKRIYHAAFSAHDRFFHPRRHLAVVRRLAKAPRPRRILVVCHGNICRSPYLQAVLQRGLPDISIASAGFVGRDEPAPQASVSLCAQRGLDLSNHRSQPINQSLIADSDFVIVMDAKQARQIRATFKARREQIVVAGDLEPTFESTRAIRDPWNQSIEVFAASFDRLDRCADFLIAMLEAGREPGFNDGNR